MKVTVTHEEAVKIEVALKQTLKRDIDQHLAYAIGRNLSRVKEEIEAIKEAQKPLENIVKEREEICKKYAEKDKNGRPKIKNNIYLGLDNNDDFDAENAELREKRKPIEEKFENFLKETTEIDFYAIKKEWLPNPMNGEDFVTLMPLIEDEAK